MPKRHNKSRFSLGRLIIILIVATAIGIGSIAYVFSSNNTPPGFPFQCLGMEGSAFHIHPQLYIKINGQNVVIPSQIGIVNSGRCFEPLHTHDSTGLIHVESHLAATQYTLSHFFQTWDATFHTASIGGTNRPVVFNSTDLMGFRADSTHRVVLFVNEVESSSYGSLVLNSLNGVNITAAYLPTG